MPEITTNKSFLQNLWDRRFFQYFATYLGVCWGLIQFSEWIINRYGFASSMIDHIALFLFGVVPSMAAFIYVHGAPGHDEWKPFEKVLYPLNLVFALAASVFLIDGQAQSTTRQIAVANEAGDTIIRVVPKMEFTKRVVFFPLKSDLDEKEKWLEIGVPVLSDLDIEQDMEWYSVRPTSLKEECEDYGYDYLKDIPFSVKIKVAKDLYCDYFVDGNISKIPTGYAINLKIVRTRDGKEMYQNNLEATNIYGLADQISSALNNNIDKIKLEKENTYVDLPSSDLISDKEEALEAYVNARMLLNTGKDGIGPAYQEIQKSVNVDPNCAECYILMAQIQSGLGMDGSQAANKSVQLSENLPERQKLEMKFFNYSLSREPGKARKLLEFWKNLYPQDVLPFSRLITLNKMTFNFKKAREIAQEAREAGHTGSILLTSADIAVKTGNLDEAQKFIAEYEKRFPEKAAKKSLLGEVYFAKGDYNEAIQIYEQNSILNPNNLDIYNKLAEVHIYNLDFKNGFAAFEDAFSVGRNFRDTLEVHQKIMGISIIFGMVDRFEDSFEKSRQIYYKNYPKAAFIQPLMTAGAIYGAIQDFETIDKIKEEIFEITPEPSLPIIKILVAYLDALWKSDSENYPAAWNGAKDFMIASVGETAAIQGELFTHYFKEDWEKVIEVYMEFSEIAGSDSNNAAPLITESFVNLGRTDEGVEIIDQFLKTSPNNPNLLFSKFKLLANGKKYKEAEKMIKPVEASFEYTDDRWEFKAEFIEMRDKLLMSNG